MKKIAQKILYIFGHIAKQWEQIETIMKLNKDADKVSFIQPLTWSPKQLDRFLTEPSIVQLLSDPGAE